MANLAPLGVGSLLAVTNSKLEITISNQSQFQFQVPRAEIPYNHIAGTYCYEPKEWGRLRYINCAILRSTKHGYLQEGN